MKTHTHSSVNHSNGAIQLPGQQNCQHQTGVDGNNNTPHQEQPANTNKQRAEKRTEPQQLHNARQNEPSRKGTIRRQVTRPSPAALPETARNDQPPPPGGIVHTPGERTSQGRASQASPSEKHRGQELDILKWQIPKRWVGRSPDQGQNTEAQTGPGSGQPLHRQLVSIPSWAADNGRLGGWQSQPPSNL